MSKETTGQVFGLMDNLLEKIRAEKRASQKRATDGSEPTTHPVMNAPDGTQPAREGSRSSENEADVEQDYGVLGNTGQEDANSASSMNPADSIGTQSQASDEVKGNVAKPKPVKDGPAENGRGDASPGHPSNETFSGEEAKYASAISVGNKLLALLANAMGKTAQEGEEEEEEEEESENAQEKEEESVPSPKSDAADKEKAAGLKKKAGLKKTAEEIKKEAAQKYREEAEAGYMAAGLLASQLGFGKEAADEQMAVNAQLEGIIKTAQDDAVLLVDYLQGLDEGSLKAASDNSRAFKKIAQPGMEGLDLGEAPPVASGEGIPAAALMGAGGGEVGAGGEGGEGEDAAAVELLAQALAEAGIGPEELAAIAQGGGDAGGEMGGEPEAPGGGGDEGIEGITEEAAAEGEPLEEEKAEQEAKKEASLKLRAQRKLMALLSR
jgi:hypothetical protein